MDIIGDKESDAVSKKAIALTKQNCSCHKSHTKIRAQEAYSCNTSLRQHFTHHSFGAKESTGTTIATAAHTQIICPKDSQGCQRLQQLGKQWKELLMPERLESPGFFFYHQVLRSGSAKQETCTKELPLLAIAVPGLSQVRRASWNSRLSQCSHLGTLIYKDFSHSLGRDHRPPSCWNTLCSQPAPWDTPICTYQQ